MILRLVVAWVHRADYPDALDYRTLATRILEAQSYQVGGLYASRMPGYPVFLAFLVALVGWSMAPFLQALFCGLSVYLTYRLVQRWDPVAGLLAAGLVAIDPMQIALAGACLSDGPFGVSLLVSLNLLLEIFDRPEATQPWLMLGISWTAGVYLRAAALWGLLPLLIWTTVQTRRWEKALAVFLLMVLGLSPWALRNSQLLGESPTMLTSLEGISLYESVYAQADGGPRQMELVMPPSWKALNEMQRSRAWWNLAWREIRENPGRTLRQALVKIARTWSPWFHAREVSSFRVQFAAVGWSVTVFLLAVWGISLRPPGTILLLILLVLGYFTALHALFLGSVRYRVPLMPLVEILAGWGLRYGAAGALRKKVS